MCLTKEFLSLQAGSSFKKKKKNEFLGPAGWKNGKILSHAEPEKCQCSFGLKGLVRLPGVTPACGRDTRAAGAGL